MLTLTEIFSILIIHWIADFWCQTDKQAKGKSSSWTALLSHTVRYSWIWVFGMWLMLAVTGAKLSTYDIVVNCLAFGGFTFVAHTITDYFTSRLNAYWWTRNKRWEFFVSVGGDQILHYIQLFLTYQLLK